MAVRFKRRRRWILPSLAAAGLLALFVTIDDWSRDFTTNYFVMTETARDPALRPILFERPSGEVVVAVQEAALRIKNWELVGTVKMDDTTMIAFERTSRVLRFKDDIIVRVEDLGNRCRVGGESRSRREHGDLGQNPRNLRRILSELQTVLD